MPHQRSLVLQSPVHSAFDLSGWPPDGAKTRSWGARRIQVSGLPNFLAAHLYRARPSRPTVSG
jgi:hypothetical protein